MSRTQQKIRSDIAEVGWHVVRVLEDAEGPGFAYSIGFGPTLDHPEVVAFGLPLESMHVIVNLIGAEIRNGHVFRGGDATPSILEGHPVAFRDVSSTHYDDYLSQAATYYEADHRELRVVQCFWPDANSRFPWDDGVEPSCSDSQPTLSTQKPA